VLFGCFNCSGTDMDSWKPVALAMLEQIVLIRSSAAPRPWLPVQWTTP
jgi:hypothetical protein